MRTTPMLSLAGALLAVFLVHPVHAQEVRIHLHKQGDTLSVRNARVTIDHEIEARGDASGIVKVPNLDDGGHVIEASATGYLFLTDNFDTGSDIPQPIEIEMFPDNGKPTVGPQVNSTPQPGGTPTR